MTGPLLAGEAYTDDIGAPSSAPKPPSEDIFSDNFELAALAPANDVCQTAESISIGTPAVGTTVGAIPNYDNGLEICTGYAQAGADVVYKITLSGAQAITVKLTAPSATFDPSISLLGPGSAGGVCDAAPVTCLAGADAAGFGADEGFQFTTVGAGTYYIIVDTFYSPPSGGAFTLTVTSPYVEALKQGFSTVFDRILMSERRS